MMCVHFVSFTGSTGHHSSSVTFFPLTLDVFYYWCNKIIKIAGVLTSLSHHRHTNLCIPFSSRFIIISCNNNKNGWIFHLVFQKKNKTRTCEASHSPALAFSLSPHRHPSFTYSPYLSFFHYIKTKTQLKISDWWSKHGWNNQCVWGFTFSNCTS
jgi:hypothetical protein